MNCDSTEEAKIYVAPPLTVRLKRQVAVSWFDLKQLLATAGKTIAATIVGSMSGRRELMAALDPGDKSGVPEFLDFSQCSEFWFDYVADTGDGWNATMSVAWLLGRDAIRLEKNGLATPQPVPASQDEEPVPAENDALVLPRGELLVMGGDQVYPTASPEAYNYRFSDPFACARFSQTPPRTMLAIPGNHDWYDGLTSFIRLFCQKVDARRWFGAWRATQRRSYFAARLPHGWWLWGIDTALGDDLDPPQYDYFREAAAQLGEGDKVILCIPGPHWVMEDEKERREDLSEKQLKNKLKIIVRLAECDGRSEVPLILTGDLHYYAHFRSEEIASGGDESDRHHYLICGGGGAFGLGTLQVPKTIVVGEERAARVESSIFPSQSQSKKLRRGVWRFPLRNLGFTAVLVAIQLIALWLIHTVNPEKNWTAGWIGYAMAQDFSFAGLGTYLWAVLRAVPYPALLLGTLAMIAGFSAFAISGKKRSNSSITAGLIGAFHGLLQIVGSTSLVWLCSQLVNRLLGDTPLGVGEYWIAILVSAVVLFFWCGFLFGAYLFFGHKFADLHDQEVFSAQGIEDFRSFLRIRISPDAVTIFPIGLREVARKWKTAPGVKTVRNGEAEERDEALGWTVALRTPEGCARVVDPAAPLAPHLIEKHFTLRGPKRR